MGAEQGLACLFEMLFACIKESVDPRKKLLRAVVGMEDDGNAIGFSHQMNVLCSRDGAQDLCLLAFELHALAGEKLCATVRDLDDNGRASLCCRLDDALMESVLMTLTAGSANLFARAWAKISWTAAPVATPGLTISRSFLDIRGSVRAGGKTLILTEL